MYALGIDLGTTWTAAATWRDGRAETVPLGERAHTVPSVVLVEPDGSLMVGESAARRQLSSPDRGVAEFKRRFGDPVPFLVAGSALTAADLTTGLLTWVVDRVSEREGGAPAQVVLTVPATWRTHRSDLLRQCAAESGLAADHLTLLPEPVAAAVHYAGNQRVPVGCVVGVYDLGGGTFDATMLVKTQGGFAVLGQPVGSDHLGGVDMDHAVFRRLSTLLGVPERTTPTDRATGAAMARLRADCVVAKEDLSTSMSTVVPVLIPDAASEIVLTREELERDVEPVVDETVRIFAEAVKAAGVELGALDRVLLVGGASRMPLVQRSLAQQVAGKVSVDTHPKYAVCLGAAIAAGSTLQGRAGRVPEALAPAPSSASVTSSPLPVIAQTVDLASSGLTDASDVPLRPAVDLRHQAPVAADEPLRVHLGGDEDDRSMSRTVGLTLLAVLAAMLILALVVALT